MRPSKKNPLFFFYLLLGHKIFKKDLIFCTPFTKCSNCWKVPLPKKSFSGFYATLVLLSPKKLKKNIDRLAQGLLLRLRHELTIWIKLNLNL